MAVITRINGIPLFDSIQGALRWGRFNRLKGGYHVHYWEGQKGYMGGNNHSEIVKRRPIKIDPKTTAQRQANRTLSQRNPIQTREPIQPQQRIQPQQPRRTQPIQPTTRRTSSGGGY